MNKKFDFGGWATKNNLKCSDGRVIIRDAFKHNDGNTVPLVWNHQHNDPLNILGHAVLENREEGVYAYCTFNNTEAGQNAKQLVEHGDVSALSIYANKLQQQGSNVLHGEIREVSLVLAGANPGAFIDSIIRHGEESDEEAVVYTGEYLDLSHSDGEEEEMENNEETKSLTQDEKELEHADENKTVEDVFNTLNEEQKNVVYALIGQAIESKGQNDNQEEQEGEPNMKHNVFDKETENKETTLSHSEMQAVIADAKRYGSMKDSALAHGIENVEFLFPDARNVSTTPDFIQREMGWVQTVMGGTHHVPFSRIKSMHADITEDEARAKGFIKGKLKKEEVFSLMKRTTDPTTIYKKQKMDRDDVIDITDFDVIAWLKAEMRMMLDEEIARAILVGDGRLSSSDDKISEDKIRPIWKDADLYTVKHIIPNADGADSDKKARAFIKAAIKSRKNYKGSGNPKLFTTEDMVTDCLLLEDTTGRRIYNSVADLATALRVSEIVTVPVMEGLTRNGQTQKVELLGLIVNLKDYNLGADKGGAINMFDDFDIDYNQQKYLIETRCSGALVKPFSAVAIEFQTNTSND